MRCLLAFLFLVWHQHSLGVITTNPTEQLLQAIVQGRYLTLQQALEDGADIHALHNAPFRWATLENRPLMLQVLRNRDTILSWASAALQQAGKPRLSVATEKLLRAIARNSLADVIVALHQGADEHGNNEMPLRWAEQQDNPAILQLLR
ncbi:hypothetical protein M1466_01635 [Candidatus Dependentiae bacterium]|nr:hypothetical protein [Candidatus Dependentiae bacterium]